MKISALILAAGLSSRIKGFKPLLEIDGKSLFEHVYGLFADSGIDDIVTVVGHRSADLIPVVKAVSSRYVINYQYQDGMFSSIQKGAEELKGACDAFFLLPVDIPFVRPATIHGLVAEYSKDPLTLVCYPQFNSRRGHPPLIDGRLAEQILTYDGQDGMRGFLKQHKDRSRMVSVDDPFILKDIDTEEDLSAVKQELLKRA
ncbi:MAG: nucleotidyltransferase family protein [Deltaproteobacteria bacterium]|jgi:CTP:molybdopterin cytidylyltransferase MocA|nr:nucleotidyltransferase family protein [Deltaproteobacteria bacterium]